MLTVTLEDPRDAARLVDALIVAAEVKRTTGYPLLAKRYLLMADRIGDALEACTAQLLTGHPVTLADGTVAHPDDALELAGP